MRQILPATLFFLLLATVSSVHLSMLGKPFIGHHDWNSVLHGQIVRNNLRYGLTTTRFGQVTNAGVTSPDKFSYHTHHPILWPLLLTASATIFGLHEWTIRLVPFLASQGMLIVYFVLIRRYFGSFIGLISIAFLVTTPMFLYFGILPDKEPLVLFLILLTLSIYLFYQDTGRRLWLVLMFILIGVGGLTHWLFYLLPPVFFLHHLIVKRKPKQSLFLLFVVCCLLSVALAFHLWHTHLLTADWLGGGLRETLGFRLSSSSGDRTSFTTLEYISRLFVRLGNYFGWIVLPFVGIGLLGRGERWLTASPAPFSATKNYMEKKSNIAEKLQDTSMRRLDLSATIERLSLIFLFLLIGLLYPIVFRNYVYIHDYLLYYLLPFWGLAAALGVVTVCHWLKKKFHLRLPSQLLTLGISLLLIIAALIDRAPMIAALRGSDWYSTGRTVGLAIAKHTDPHDSVVLLSPEIGENYGRFIDFYGDRKVTYLEQDVKIKKLETFDTVLTFSAKPVASKEELTESYDLIQEGEIQILRKRVN